MFLNLDAGERADETDDLWSLADLLNCACGGHAGDAALMDRVATFCARSGVKLGAHPSYPDRDNFGRRSPLAGTTAPDARRLAEVAVEAGRATLDQCRALTEVARRHQVAVVALKPHGALYHDASAHRPIADALLGAAVDALGRDVNVTVVGPAVGALREEAARLHLPYAREGFADRRRYPDGTLVPRGEPDALITNPAEAAAQARALRASVETICVHGDTPGAAEILAAVRAALGA